jgi:hypothetical protein
MATQVAPAANIDVLLRELATAKNPQAREQAVTTLLQMGYSFPQIIQMSLNHAGSAVRLWGVMALGQNGDFNAANLLLPLINDSDRKVRLAAISQLGRFGNPVAIAPMVDRLKKTNTFLNFDGYTTNALVAALSQFNYPEADEAVARYRKKARFANMVPLLIIVGIFAILGIGFVVNQTVRGVQSDPFKNNLAEYTNTGSFKEQVGATPYIKGKIVVVNKADIKVDDPYFDLPEDVKAVKPEEVGTIVWVTYDPRLVGRYTNGAAGYQYTATVTVIDKANGTIVGRSSFTGSEPPSTKKGSGDAYGSKPSDDIKNYLLGLPRK